MLIITPEDVMMYRRANMKTAIFFTKVIIVSKGINTYLHVNMIFIILSSDSRHYSYKMDYFNFNILAFMATITVLKLISTAPIAGLSIKFG